MSRTAGACIALVLLAAAMLIGSLRDGGDFPHIMAQQTKKSLKKDAKIPLPKWDVVVGNLYKNLNETLKQIDNYAKDRNPDAITQFRNAKAAALLNISRLLGPRIKRLASCNCECDKFLGIVRRSLLRMRMKMFRKDGAEIGILLKARSFLFSKYGKTLGLSA